MPARFRHPVGALGPGTGSPRRTPASHLCGGRGQGAPSGACGALWGQRHEDRDRQRARAPSCAGGPGGGACSGGAGAPQYFSAQRNRFPSLHHTVLFGAWVLLSPPPPA